MANNYIYKELPNRLGDYFNKDGTQLKQSGLKYAVIHHDAGSQNASTESAIKTISNEYLKNGRAFPYKIVIGHEDDDKVYLCGQIYYPTVHCNSVTGNLNSVSIMLHGNYENDKPTVNQLRKLNQVLLDIKNGELVGRFNPFERTKIEVVNDASYGRDVQVIGGRTTWHNEIAQKVGKTQCCGKNLIPYVQKIQSEGESWINSIEPKAEVKPVEVTVPTPEPIVTPSIDPSTIIELNKKINDLELQLKDATVVNNKLTDELGQAVNHTNELIYEIENYKKVIKSKDDDISSIKYKHEIDLSFKNNLIANLELQLQKWNWQKLIIGLAKTQQLQSFVATVLLPFIVTATNTYLGTNFDASQIAQMMAVSLGWGLVGTFNKTKNG